MSYCPDCNNPVAADALTCAICDAQFGAGNAWKPTGKPGGPPRPPRQQKAASVIPAASDVSGQKKSGWRYLWPKIYDIESARFATQYGIAGAALGSVVSAAVATISLVAQKPILGLDAWAYVDAILMAIVAWRINHFSRVFAICGVALGVLNVIVTVATPLPGQGSTAFAAAIYGMIVFFINGARGVFAYNRFTPTSVWGESARARVLNQPSGPARTAATTSINSATEDKFFEQALTEIESGQTIKAIWARSLAGAEGDDAKARALYIRLRVENLTLLSAEGPTPSEIETRAEDRQPATDTESPSTGVQQASKSTPTAGFSTAFLIVVGVIILAIVAPFLIPKEQPIEAPLGVSTAPSIEDEQAVTAFRNILTKGTYLQNEDTAKIIRKFLALKKGAEFENEMAQNMLNRIAETKKDDIWSSSEAVIYPPPTPDELKAAERGDPKAQWWAGELYTTSVAPDARKAVFWLEKAATQGYAQAQDSLARCYLHGRGVDKNDRQAAFWFKRAAAQGLEDSQRELGEMYFEGKGVAQDYVEAHTLLSLAGRSGGRFDGGKYERERREMVEKLMTQEQIAQAQRRASEWIKAHSH